MKNFNQQLLFWKIVAEQKAAFWQCFFPSQPRSCRVDQSPSAEQSLSRGQNATGFLGLPGKKPFGSSFWYALDTQHRTLFCTTKCCDSSIDRSTSNRDSRLRVLAVFSFCSPKPVCQDFRLFAMIVPGCGGTGHTRGFAGPGFTDHERNFPCSFQKVFYFLILYCHSYIYILITYAKGMWQFTVTTIQKDNK